MAHSLQASRSSADDRSLEELWSDATGQIVALVYLAVALVALGKARKQAAEISLVLQQTAETVKEDVQWA